MTSVTEREVRSHLHDSAKSIVEQLEKLKRLTRPIRKYVHDEIFEKIDETMLRDRMQKGFDDFIAETKIEKVSVNEVTPDAIFDMYFNLKPPFEQGKKSEFPDAFAYLALKAWCEKHNTKMYVVSGDTGLSSACKDYFLIYLKTIQEVLELFQDSEIVGHIKLAFEAQRRAIEALIEAEAEKFEYYISNDIIDN